MDKRFMKGQGILEYTLILGAVIAVIVAVLLIGPNSLKNRVQGAYDAHNTALDNTTNDLTGGVFQGGGGGGGGTVEPGESGTGLE